MLPRKHPDRIRVSFHIHRLVASAWLSLAATLICAPACPTGPEAPRPRNLARLSMVPKIWAIGV